MGVDQMHLKLLKTSFQRFDTQGNGFISQQDFIKNCLSALNRNITSEAAEKLLVTFSNHKAPNSAGSGGSGSGGYQVSYVEIGILDNLFGSLPSMKYKKNRSNNSQELTKAIVSNSLMVDSVKRQS